MAARSLGLAFLLVAAATRSAAGREAGFSAPFALHDLGRGVFAAVATAGSDAGANAGFVIGDDGVLVIDTFYSDDAARALEAAIHERTELPIRYVVNTHYHLDHVGGNAVFAASGAIVVAERHVRAWARTENLKFFGSTPTAAQRARVDAIALPALVYSEEIDLYLGKRKLEVRHLPGHTGSDSIVVVRDAGVVFAGDLFWNAHLPNLVDATTGAWAGTLRGLLTQHPNATFIPGHGEVGHGSDVEAFGAYLVALRDAVARALAEKPLDEALVAKVEPTLRARYGAWGFFEHFVAKNILLMAAELRGKKPLPGMQAP